MTSPLKVHHGYVRPLIHASFVLMIQIGLAVWLVPVPEDAVKLKQLMRVPLDYRVPSFEPHITIASFSASTTHEELQAALTRQKTRLDLTSSADVEHPKPHMSLAFRALSTEDAFFRSVLIDIIPSPALENLRDLVFQALPYGETKSPRFPHLSLYYIPDEYAADRERTRNGLWAKYGRAKDDAGKPAVGFQLPSAETEGEDPGLLTGMTVTEIQIVRCEGPPEGWEVMHRISLERLQA